MKYILNRNNFIKESFLNPDGNDEQKVEWEDTLIGSLLNRLYGSSKNAAKTGSINRLANKLDAAIARIFISKTIENEPDLKEDINNISNDKALQTVTLIAQDIEKIEDLSKVQITILLQACDECIKQLGANDDITKYLNEFNQLLLDASKEDNTKLIANSEYVLVKNGDKLPIKIDSITDLDIIYYYVSDPSKKLNAKRNKIKSLGGNQIAIVDNDTVDSEYEEMPSDDEIKNASELINKYKSNKSKIDPEIFTLHADKIKKFEELIDKPLEDLTKREIELIITMTNALLTKLDNKKIDENAVNSTINDIDKTRLSSNINKVRELVKERRRNYKVSKEEVEKIDTAVKNQSKNIINGNDLREIVNIIENARQSILTNNYEDLRKKQKRYYIPIQGGLAVHKATFDAWSKRVQNIVAYYKDLLPENFSEFLLDTLNYNSGETNGFISMPKLMKKYLGLNSDTDGNKTTSKNNNTINPLNKTKGHREETEGKNLTFVKVGRVDIELYKPMSICGQTGYKILLPVYIDKNHNVIIFKYKTNNIEWLKSYYNDDELKIDTGGIKTIKNDAGDVKLLYMEYPKDGVITKSLKYTFYKSLIPTYKNIEKKIQIVAHEVLAVYNKTKLEHHNIDVTKVNAKVFKQEDINRGRYTLYKDSTFKGTDVTVDVSKAISEFKKKEADSGV